MKQHMPPPIVERIKTLEDRLSEIDRRAKDIEEALRQTKAERTALEDLIETIRWTISQIGGGEYQNGGFVRRRPAEPEEPLTARVLKAMRELPSPVTAAQLCQRIGGGVDIRSIGPVLGKLHKEHVIRRREGGAWEFETSNNNHTDSPAMAGG